MPQHEIKHCPRCGHSFECKQGSILLCQCSEVTFTQEELAWLQSQYQDCLCLQCLKLLKAEFQAEQEN